MRIKIEQGHLKLHVYDLLGLLDADQKKELVEVLAVQDDVIKHVVEQVLTGWTENGMRAARQVTAGSGEHYLPALDEAIREVSKRSGDVARKEIERLEAALKYKDELLQRMNEELQKLHAFR